MSTDSLRQQKILERQALNYTQQRTNAQQLCMRIIRDPIYKKAQHVAVYFAQQGEISLEPLIREALKAGKAIYVPVILPEFTMRFARFQHNTRLIKNRFGILEPAIKQFVPTPTLNLILCPLVAFDANCTRIGMGGGFYDRALAEPKLQKDTAIWGVAHNIQRCPTIKAQPWDISMRKIVTEKQTYSATR